MLYIKKWSFASIIFLLICFYKGNAQNTYDTYFNNNTTCPYAALDPNSGSQITGKVLTGYTGEYQIFLAKYPPSGTQGHPWVYSPTLNTNTITYKIEVVSFPFTPNCYSCQTFITPAPTQRIFYMPDNQFPYDASQKAWVRDISSLPPPTIAGSVNDLVIQKEFTGIYGDPSSPFVEDNIQFSTLVSEFIAKSGEEAHINERIYYPHTILKHTFYMHCGDQTQPIVDSFSFVLDHTRGRMSYYPFRADNISTDETEHDIAIFPIWYPKADASLLNTIEYFSMLQTPSNCQSHIPDESGSLDDFIRPEPGTLLQVLLASNLGQSAAGTTASQIPQPGILHQYEIDRTFDLNIINPSEKIIYNPSDVAINLNKPYNITPASRILTFPSGYTFKTVNGIYPTVAQVEAGDPQDLHYYQQDIVSENTLNILCDDVGPDDGYFSYYRVKNGSTLIIEPCVRLYDVKIIVETGAELFYNSQELTGRHYSIESTGGIINNAATGIPSYSNCPFNCYNNAKFDIVGDYEINTNKTWNASNILAELDASLDGQIEIGGTIIIKSGNTVTMNGPLKLAFGETGKIVVERNAKLIINGSGIGSEVVLTSVEFCNQSMWEGIQVLGNHFASQGTPISPSSSQGYLLLNRAIIENARTAVKFGIDGTNAYNGGVLNSSLSTFRNNIVDIEFKPYNHLVISSSGALVALNYAAQIGNCTFETTKKLNDPHLIAAGSRPIACNKHIILNNVKNVKILANKFQNIATNSLGGPLFDADIRGTGIYSSDAIVSLNSGILANTFYGLSEGFWGISTGGLKYVSIDGNHFYNNIHSIVLEGTKLSTINSNDFSIPASSNNSILLTNSMSKGYNKPVGLYLIGALNFTAEENTFTNYGPTTSATASSDSFNYGIVVNNCSGSASGSPKSGGSIGYLYKNVFNNLNINLQSELDNKGGAGTGSGLSFGCNEFNTRINKDVTVVGDVLSSELGYLRNQGLCALPEDQAGNGFTSACSIDEELWFDNEILTAYASSTYSSFIYSDQPSAFSCTNFPSGTADFECNPLLGPNSCPSNLSSCLTIPCLTTSFDNAQIAAKQILTSYNQLIDGGNTSFLLNQISSSMPAGQLKNLLISKSPYLSDEVLIATLNRNDLTPYGHIEQIFISNSPVTMPVMAAVQNAELPSGILNNILASQTGISARSEKENELDYYLFRAKLAKVKLEQAYLEVDNKDSIKSISEKDTTLSSLYNLIDILIDKADYADAHDCLNAIHSKEGPIHSNECNINSIRLNLAENNKSWFNMDSSQVSIITNICENNEETAIQARNILSLIKGKKYSRYPYNTNSSERTMVSISEDLVIKEPYEVELVNYPNPFTRETNIKALLPETERFGELIITDIMGRIIATYKLEKGINNISFQTNNLQNAIYFYYMTNANGLKIKSNKMILSR